MSKTVRVSDTTARMLEGSAMIVKGTVSIFGAVTKRTPGKPESKKGNPAKAASLKGKIDALTARIAGTDNASELKKLKADLKNARRLAVSKAANRASQGIAESARTGLMIFMDTYRGLRGKGTLVEEHVGTKK